MQKIIFYVAVALCLFVSKLTAQETFEQRAKVIAQNIENITTEEKQALKDQLNDINVRVSEGKLTQQEADAMKIDLANIHAKKIEQRVALEQEKMNTLIQDKVDGKIKLNDSIRKRSGTSIVLGGDTDKIGENQTQIDLLAMKVYEGDEDYQKKKSKRTTSQFVFAVGLSNVVTENEDLEKSDFRVWGSHYYEWGVTYNTRIFKNHNLLHAKYGVSLMYNNLRPTDNRYFVRNGNQTELATSGIELKDSRFRMVNLVFPVHLEFDLSPKKVKDDGTTYFRTHKSLRVGLGGYAGVNVKSKQITKFEQDGNDFKVKEKGDFNTSDFVYGVSTYIGWKETSLYLKYDLNDVFKDNPVKQNNVALGVRFDFN
ncbi:hypothetical protein ABGT15_01225 [Flavobacterium enshiense]|uniref:hypothetical protein n=1 Tax=Flavobacterium enshiense TaxID=1341165 RepID=UPI00345DB770